MDRPLDTGNLGGSGKLDQIHEGMAVFDLEDNRIGKVDLVYLGSVDQGGVAEGQGPRTTGAMNEPRGRTVLDLAADAFAGDEDQFPQTVRDRLMREGFIRVGKRGLLGGSRYVTPDQIGSVSEDRVQLSVLGEELLKS